MTFSRPRRRPDFRRCSLIRFPCPHCGAKLYAAPDKAGDRRECPRCGRSIAVPGTAALPSPAGPQSWPVRPDRRRLLAVGAGTLAVLGAAGILAYFGSGPSRQQRAIERAYAADRSASERLKAMRSDAPRADIAAAIREYARRLSGMDLADCPADFQVAYRRHARAWEQFAVAFEGIPDGFWNQVVDGTFNLLLRGEHDGGLNRLQGEIRTARARVVDSWDEVAACGAKYGAAPPPQIGR